MSELVQCNQLFKKYGECCTLNGIDLIIPKGRIVGLLGPNGSGKTTLMKLMAGILTPTQGEILINGERVGVESKKTVSFLPERTYLNDWMKIKNLIQFFSDFYEDFSVEKAEDMLERLHINPLDTLKTMSKGTKEKVQLVLVMSRQADLYLLDEPLGGVDPATRDYILNTIISNYHEEATLIISTHLIYDIEKILDDVIVISQGTILMQDNIDDIREQHGMSMDNYFKEVFRC